MSGARPRSRHWPAAARTLNQNDEPVQIMTSNLVVRRSRRRAADLFSASLYQFFDGLVGAVARPNIDNDR